MLNRNFLKEKLEAGESVVGTWCMIPSPVTIDIMGSAGFDFLIIDREHGPMTTETAQEMMMACEARGVSPVLRVPGLVEGDILHGLDIGAHCIQVPNVSQLSHVNQLIDYAKYPPVGKRGFSPFTRAGNYSIHNKEVLTQKANENTLLAINIEGEDAIKEIDSLLAIKELDIIFIGLFDLSKALGIPGQIKDPKVTAYLEELVDKINKAGKVAGTIATAMEDIQAYKKLGIRYLLYLVDCELLRDASERVVKEFKRA